MKPYMETNISKDNLHESLINLHTDLTATANDELARMKHSTQTLEQQSAFIKESQHIIDTYKPLFEKITTLSDVEFEDPAFSNAYAEIAIELAYLYGHINAYGTTIKMFDIASERMNDPFLKILYQLQSTSYRHHMLREYPSYEQPFTQHLVKTTKDFLELIGRFPHPKLFTSYIDLNLPKGRLILALYACLPHIQGTQAYAYSMLAYLHHKNGNEKRSKRMIDRVYLCETEMDEQTRELVYQFIDEEILEK